MLPLINPNEGALVLSTQAGAHERLRPHPVGGRPGDLAAHADALHTALRFHRP